ncbi:hypothetical protein C8R43DRAFT_1145685 [Mycena crocata]|nr:hypothetical protein C8R43DRAFT_1145685 [Mycena crocata]
MFTYLHVQSAATSGPASLVPGKQPSPFRTTTIPPIILSKMRPHNIPPSPQPPQTFFSRKKLPAGTYRRQMQFVVAAISSRALTPFSSRGGAAQRRRHRKHYILCSRERRKILGMPYVLPSNRCRHQLSNSDTIFAPGRRRHRKHYISRSRERPKILGKRPPAGSPIIECNWPSFRSSTPSAPRRGARNENPTHRLPAVAPRNVSYASRGPASKIDFWPSRKLRCGTDVLAPVRHIHAAVIHRLDVHHFRLQRVDHRQHAICLPASNPKCLVRKPKPAIKIRFLDVPQTPLRHRCVISPLISPPTSNSTSQLSIVAASTSRQRPNTSCTSAELGPELKFDFWPSGEVHRGTASSSIVQHSALGVKFTIFFLRLRRGVYLGWEGLLVRKDDFFSLHPQRSPPSAQNLEFLPPRAHFSPRRVAARVHVKVQFIHFFSIKISNFSRRRPTRRRRSRLRVLTFLLGLEPHFEV